MWFDTFVTLVCGLILGIVSGKLAPVFLAPLLLMMAGYVLLFVSLWMVRIRTAILERRATSLMQRGA